jgi:hypothetical protein
VQADDNVTEPMRSRADHVLHAPAEPWHSAPVESWHSLLEDEPIEPIEPAPAESSVHEPPRDGWRWGYLPPEGQGDILDELLGDLPAKPKVEPIGFAHNGFHVDDEQRFQPLPPPAPQQTRPSRHERATPSRHERATPSRHERATPSRHERATPSRHERATPSRHERATPSRHERATPSRHERPARHFLPEEQLEKRPFWFESDGRHSREGPDDASTYGRHSMPGRD